MAASLAIALLVLGCSPTLRAQSGSIEYIWWEAESTKATDFPPPARNPFAPLNPQESSVLSGRQWIGVTGDRDHSLFLEYDVTLPKTASYQFFSRKFWQHGPFRWCFDSQPWQTVGKNVVLLDDASLRQFVGANWVKCGTVELAAGKHSCRIELLENSGAACFDCFLLTTESFVPRGKLKPGEKYNRAPAGWFPFEPDADPFANSPIDLRYLNEKNAGENGFIQAKGEEFVQEKTGKPIRFWAVNTGGESVNMDQASTEQFARGLAKAGVNMVRIHGPVWGRDFRQPDKDHLDKLFYFIAALKKQGIYTGISIYFPLWLQLRQGSGFEGYAGKNPFALLYFSPEFQAFYRGWWKSVLNTPNPYTGKPLSEEPAVAFAELVNEDSYLFWTFNYDNIPGPQMALLEKQYGSWLATKYGSLAKAFQSWGGGPQRGDDMSAGRAGFRGLWEMSHNKDRRSQDTATFLTLSQREFYDKSYRYLKNDLRFKGLVYGSNWITADATVLGPLDKWSNAGCDFMDRHGYFGGPHEGPAAGYSIRTGDKFDDKCALLFQPNKPGEQPDFNLPIMDIRYNGKPSTITEINWTPPNRFRADTPLLCAAYGSLQGTDGFFFFATGNPGWDQNLAKFGIKTPAIFGQFPAAALIYRHRLVQPAQTVVNVNLKLDDLFALKGAPVSAPLNLDEFRAKDIPTGKSAEVTSISSLDPLAFLVGKVGIDISKDGGTSRTADLSKYIDRNAKKVVSQTGELSWDYGNGLVKVNSPQAQGATGFLSKAGTIELLDMKIKSEMEYGAITLVAMDGKPVAQSGKILLQVMSEETNYGFDAPGAGLRTIKEVGSAPIVVKNLQGTITLKRSDALDLKVTSLNFNGYRTSQVRSGPAIALEPKTIYYLIEK